MSNGVRIIAGAEARWTAVKKLHPRVFLFLLTSRIQAIELNAEVNVRVFLFDIAPPLNSPTSVSGHDKTKRPYSYVGLVESK